jgi:alkylation response protein AidB-like acyl-CoA dehydrogenase
VNFDFSDEQNMLRDQARRFLVEAGGREQLRRWLDGDADASAELWPRLAEMGWLGAAIAEEHGGLGLGVLELCVLAEELGRTLSPLPFFGTVCVGAALLAACPGGARRDDLLQRIASGECRLALAGSAWPGGAGALQGEPASIDGEVAVVADLLQATDLLIAVRDASGEESLVWVDAAHAQRDAIDSFDPLKPHGRLRLQGAAGERLHRGAELQASLREVQLRAAVIAAFEQIGTADAALQLARDYTLQRYAFGRPLAGNQAVKHRLADMLVKIELARSNAYFGAWAADVGDPALPAAAAAARLSATDALNFAAEEGLHLHGGIGYTWEADCHLYVRRARLLATQLGTPTHWAKRLLASSQAAA